MHLFLLLPYLLLYTCTLLELLYTALRILYISFRNQPTRQSTRFPGCWDLGENGDMA